MTPKELREYVQTNAAITHGGPDHSWLTAEERQRCADNETGYLVQGWVVYDHELLTARVLLPMREWRNDVERDAVLHAAAVHVLEGLVASLQAHLRHVEPGTLVRTSPILGIDSKPIVVTEKDGKVEALPEVAK